MTREGPVKRDNRRDQAYFDAQVAYNEEMLGKFDAAIANPATAPDHRRRLLHTVFRQSVEQLITRYSRGEDLSALREFFPRIVASLARYNAEAGHPKHDFEELDAYVIAIWLVSLGILLEVETSLFADLVRELGNEGRDALYERLVASRFQGRVGPTNATLLHPRPYRELLRALDAAGSEQAGLLVSFLEDYYGGLKDAYWHDSHLGEDAGFFGYWCFELAAAVKAFGLDDSRVRSNPLYPRDLLTTGQRA